MHALNKFSRISKSKLLKVPRKKNFSGRLIFFFPPKHGFGPCTNIKIHCSFFPSVIKNIRTSPVSCALSCIHSSRGPTESGLYFCSCHANFPACCLSRSTHTHMPEHLQTHILPYFLTAVFTSPKRQPQGVQHLTEHDLWLDLCCWGLCQAASESGTSAVGEAEVSRVSDRAEVRAARGSRESAV